MRRWPAQFPIGRIGEYSLSPVDSNMRSEMEVGRARVRKLSNDDIDRLQIAWKFTDAEMVAFRAWVRDDPWSLTGESDGLASFTTSNVTFGAVISGPQGQATARIIENTVNASHLARMTVSGLSNARAAFTATVRANGRTAARLAMVRRDDTTAFLDVNLTTGAVIGTDILVSFKVEEQPSDWWRLSAVANLGSGGSTPIMRVQVLGPSNAVSYLGDGFSGLDVTDTQAKIFTGYDSFLPTDSFGRAKGADRASAWFFLPVALGGGIAAREARFVGTFAAKALPGLNWQVNATVEIR